MDLSLACGRQLSGRFVCGGKHQSAASVWQNSLLTLPADDGKEPRLRVKTSSIACYLGPSSAGAEHTQMELNTASVATRNVFLPYFCWRVKAAKERHLSSFSLKLYIRRTSLNAVITCTVLLLQIKSMVMELEIDTADNHCMCVPAEVCTDSLRARGKIWAGHLLCTQDQGYIEDKGSLLPLGHTRGATVRRTWADWGGALIYKPLFEQEKSLWDTISSTRDSCKSLRHLGWPDEHKIKASKAD